MAPALHVFAVVCLASALWTVQAKSADSGHWCETCPDGWTNFDGHCYQFHSGEKDWADAEKFCTSLGGNLASIPSAKVYTFLRKMVFRITSKHTTTWVGGYDAAKEGVWLWSDGTKFDFNMWAKGEPNNGVGNQSCMEINYQGRDYINDTACKRKRPVICARKP